MLLFLFTKGKIAMVRGTKQLIFHCYFSLPERLCFFPMSWVSILTSVLPTDCFPGHALVVGSNWCWKRVSSWSKNSPTWISIHFLQNLENQLPVGRTCLWWGLVWGVKVTATNDRIASNMEIGNHHVPIPYRPFRLPCCPCHIYIYIYYMKARERYSY